MSAAASKRGKAESCVYCGATERLTRDHIPPKSLFGGPRPQLITVPCCRSCNQSFAKDDEYFRQELANRLDLKANPEVRKILRAVYRSWERPEGQGLRRAFAETLMPVDVIRPSGLWVGRATGFVVRLRRLERVAARITKGLFYHEFGERLPDTCAALAVCESGLPELGADDLRIIRTLTATAPKTIGERVFSYWSHRAPDHPATSVWVLVFFEKVLFLCWTLPRTIVYGQDTGHKKHHLSG